MNVKWPHMNVLPLVYISSLFISHLLTDLALATVPVPPAEPPVRDTRYEDEQEQDLGAEEDAEGEVDEGFEEIISNPNAQREEEEEEEEIPPIPSKPARNIKPIAPPDPAPAAKPKQPAAAPTKSKPAPPPRGKKQKRELVSVAPSHHLSDADEEDLEFGKPTKRARPSPSEGLALPNTSASIYTPPPPIPQPSPPLLASAPASESEEDWDEVAAVGKSADTEDDFDIFGDAAAAASVGGEGEGEGEDIDVNELEREINLQMDEASDDDFLAAVVEDASPTRGGPISLKELAGGAVYPSEDDYSSSDESDED